jgi:hypothetical protein
MCRPRRARVGRILRVACTAAFTLAVPLSAKVALAEPSRVAIVSAKTESALLREATSRLHAELTAAGFDVIEIARDDGDAREGVEEQKATTTFATVALRSAPRKTAIDVWVHDRVTGKSVVRRIEVGSSADAPRVVAIRAMELLRASLLEATAPPLETDPRNADAPVLSPLSEAPPADVARWMAPRSATVPSIASSTALVPSFGVEAGAALLQGFDGLKVTPMPSLRLWYAISERVSLRLAIAGPGYAPEVTAPLGTALVRQELAAVEIAYAFTLSPRWIVPVASLGAGAHHLHARGTPTTPGYRGASDDAWSALVDAGLGAALRFSDRAAIVVDARALVLVPRPVISVAGQTAATTGRPSALVSVGVLASF